MPDARSRRAADGEPIWPAGMTGSLAHDDQYRGRGGRQGEDVGAIGIDIEPATPLPRDMTRARRDAAGAAATSATTRCGGKLLFAAKEAVYKAQFPLDRVFLEFHDIEVDLARMQATTRTGRIVAIRYAIAPCVIVLATTGA